MNGQIEIDGKTIEWAIDGLGIVSWTGMGIYSFRLPNNPSAAEVEAGLRGWHAGYRDGRQAGRSILQNEFRNLMDVRK